jgi:hypothetical protein
MQENTHHTTLGGALVLMLVVIIKLGNNIIRPILFIFTTCA